MGKNKLIIPDKLMRSFGSLLKFDTAAAGNRAANYRDGSQKRYRETLISELHVRRARYISQDKWFDHV